MTVYCMGMEMFFYCILNKEQPKKRIACIFQLCSLDVQYVKCMKSPRVVL